MFKINLLCVFVFVLASTASAPQKVSLTIYYESQCPDSKQFILTQLQPTISLLHEYLKLKLVPFGKARSINNGYNGFQCQHGPSECAGNIVQSCALDLMQERNDVEKVSYVACEMQTEAGTRGDMECVMKAGLAPDEVLQCATSHKGIVLQLDDEYETNLISPTFIPTIVADGIFNQQVQDSALGDLPGTLCSLLNYVQPCSRHYNDLAMSLVLL